jgi:hypothetical protein
MREPRRLLTPVIMSSIVADMTRDEYLADEPDDPERMPSGIHDAQRAGAIVFTLFAPSIPLAPVEAMRQADKIELDNMAAYAAKHGGPSAEGV